ncbi:ribonuclease HI [Pseudorhizobium tarimense]|uniref:Ribonuclease HI n=1 Tax=Pseudorhizobium tarimense TaxID=1079109 RepID=A0ABV2HC39_9HYPH|nr:hypothetical protein [Pseudorhizobium tarimense]MCJ8521226.1 hypothetical protein [Pseudorhizobium tarimense]
MVESEEEKRRRWREADNQPYLPGYTYGDFQKLTRHQKLREWQKLTQRATSYLGYWKTCDVSACRGFLSEKQYSDEPR